MKNLSKHIFLFFSAAPLFLNAQVSDRAQTHWQQGVRYAIEATLDTLKQSVDGGVFISYKNNSPDTLKRIYLQVPANAFADEENTAMRELRRFQSRNVRFRRRREPALTINGLQFHSIGNATDFPLRAYKFGDTILDWPLPLPLLPNDSLTMSVVFSLDCKDFFKNTKPRDRQLDFVLWFPRLCVYDRNGWHPEPFHLMMTAQSVFADFAEFEVKLTVPGNYLVVSSGELIDGDAGWQSVTVDSSIDSLRFISWNDSTRKNLREAAVKNGARRLHFKAARAQNFIWSASPEFVRISGGSTPVHIFFRGFDGMRWAKKILKEVDGALGYLCQNIGDLAYTPLTVARVSERRRTVQPPLAMINDGDPFDLAFALSQMYFPGTVGINGIEEGWMSHGMALYFAKTYSENRFGKMGYDAAETKKDLGVLGRLYSLPSVDEVMRNVAQLYMNSSQNEAIAKPVHEYKDPLSMVANSFLKSALVYEMLRFVIGDSAFTAATREFYRAYSFQNTESQAFIDLCEKNSGQQLDWFFGQWLQRTPVVDYKKGEIRKRQLANGKWQTEVEIERKGDGIMPVEVQVDLGDGQTMTKRWDGQAESGTLVFETPEKPGTVNVDPQNRILDNRRPRLELKLDLPFMQYIHMPADAFVILWRPTLGYNDIDGLRLGVRTRSAYRAFYHNLTLQLDYAFKSHEVDGTIAYNHPLRWKNLVNRFGVMARKNEGRFETDAHLVWRGSRGVISASGSKVQIGVNYSGLLDADYGFRKATNDTGEVRFAEWEDVDVLAGYAEAVGQIGGRRYEGNGALRFETALPGGDRQFTKIAGHAEMSLQFAGLIWRSRGNMATAFGPDDLPLQDKFHAEGADARARFRNNISKSIGDSFSRQHVDGGGFLRGYAGMPLLVERYATFNLEAGPSATLAGFSIFGFYDRGALWEDRHGRSITRSNAGVAIAFGGAQSRFLGGSVLSSFSMRFYVPFYLSHPLPGEKKTQYRYYFTIAKSL
jgi:hypothetical protein